MVRIVGVLVLLAAFAVAPAAFAQAPAVPSYDLGGVSAAIPTPDGFEPVPPDDPDRAMVEAMVDERMRLVAAFRSGPEAPAAGGTPPPMYLILLRNASLEGHTASSSEFATLRQMLGGFIGEHSAAEGPVPLGPFGDYRISGVLTDTPRSLGWVGVASDRRNAATGGIDPPEIYGSGVAHLNGTVGFFYVRMLAEPTAEDAARRGGSALAAWIAAAVAANAETAGWFADLGRALGRISLATAAEKAIAGAAVGGLVALVLAFFPRLRARLAGMLRRRPR